MPRKLEFMVVNSSSHEENYSPEELKVHAPTARGWRSSRLCSYPQSLTLQLEDRSRVRKLQLLAHQYMIPSKVEFHIGDSLPNSSPLRRLGYVSLCDNQQTVFKARELKSVHVDAIGTHLRITLHQNHENLHNRFNQVALVAINVLGDSVDGNSFSTMPSREQLIEHYLGSGQQEAALDATYMGKCESISPLDDLAFDMYQDPEVAQLIRLLDQRKQQMVHQEKYEQARHLKQALADLQKVGERLARLEVEKRCALEKEQYEQAEQKRQQMEQYRRTVYHQLEAHQLLEPALISAAVSECSPCSLPSPVLSPVHTRLTVSTGTDQKSRRSKPQPDQSPEGPTESSPSSRPSFLHRPLSGLERRDRPAQRTSSPPEDLALLTSTTGPAGVSGEPEPLSEKAQREAGHAIQVFGETIVSAAYSKNWSYREDALESVQQRLKEASSCGSKEELRVMVRATVLLLKRSLQDKVSTVFQASLKLLFLLLSEVIPGAGLGRAEFSLCLEQTWPHLLPRIGDACNRLRLAAIAFVQEMSVLKDVRALQWIPCELVKPIRSTLPTRLVQSQAELLENLLAALGTNGSGFTLENIMTFCTGALAHSCSAVRGAAVRIILSMYQQHRAALLKYLPPNDHTARKNFIYKKIFDGFAKIDGTLVDETAGPQEQVQSLQEQLAALKENTDRDKSTKAQRQPAKEENLARRTTRASVLRPAKETTQVVATPESVGNYLDNLCIFCEHKDEAFTEDGLDRHYWKHCPMLRLCDHCKQVVEICSVTEHLLAECESQGSFSQCPQCTEAVPSEELGPHMEGPTCNPPSPGKASNHCPMCHANFKPGDESWKAHLMGPQGCTHNPRRAALDQRTQPLQGRAVDGSRMKQGWTVGPRGRPLGRGSRIPALAPTHRNAASKR
ncbi:centrosomal protein of 104 kDa [Eucyclogobius newberryi]|uniref:centrosomal protein of 104 kDa n=1 Tax=Eucyclogobius newberryi TaxID=166745 RepID=UPI003B5CE3A8